MVSAREARRATVLLAAVAALILPTDVSALERPHHVVVVSLPSAQASALFSKSKTEGAALGLGVFPESRDPARFIREIGYGAPHGGSISSDERPARVGDALQKAGVRIELLGGPSRIGRALDAAFRPTVPAPPPSEPTGTVTVRSFARYVDMIRSVRGTVDFVVLGVGPRTPLPIQICRQYCDEGGGVLDGGVARRPAIVTPYDVGATVLSILGVPRGEGFIGNALTTKPSLDAQTYVTSLERRLVRDASLGASVGATIVSLTIAGLIIGVLLLLWGRPALAARSAQGAWAVSAIGSIASQFVPSGRGEVRLVAVIGALMLGVALPPARTHRMARVFFGVAIATAFLFAIAPLNPGGEPGLSLWGNPLMSWRFFGMQNVQAALVAGGVVVWGVLSGLEAVSLATVTVPVVVIIGAPRVGANFVGVLTFMFGASLAVLALSRRIVKPIHVVIAGLVAGGAFLLALLADVGSPVSHGGRAAKRISEGGLSALWDFVSGRLRLNVDLIGSFPIGTGWILIAMMLAAGVLLVRWGIRVADGPVHARAAVWAGAAMGLASLVLEDSGFYSGATILAAAGAAWLIVSPSIRENVLLDGGG